MFMLTIKVYFLYNTISNICYIYYILIIHYTNYITLWVYRRRQWHPTPVLLPGESHGWRSLVGSVHGVSKVRTRLTRLHFHFSLSCTGEGNGSPLQCSCLENPRDGGAWWAAVYGVAQSRTQLNRLSSSRVCACMLSGFHCVQLFATPWTVAPRLLCPGDFPGMDTGVGCHALLQRIFLTQGLNPHILHWRWILCSWATRKHHYIIQIL